MIQKQYLKRKGFMCFALAHFIFRSRWRFSSRMKLFDLRKFNFQASHLPIKCDLLENNQKWPPLTYTKNANIAYAKHRQLMNDKKKTTNAVNVESIGKYDALEMKRVPSMKESKEAYRQTLTLEPTIEITIKIGWHTFSIASHWR